MVEYPRARKLGLKQVEEALAQGLEPNPPSLDDLMGEQGVSGTVSLGVMEIPLSLVAGTRTRGRQNLFSRGFMPLADPSSEFAMKWENLMRSQLEEGMRDPIVCYEYLQRFYVQEGNKRVSVARCLDMPTIPAKVTRILPQRSDSTEYALYQEFLRFYAVAPMYGLIFSKLGSYERLAKILGSSLDTPWEELSVKRMKAAFLRFERALAKQSSVTSDSETTADAFLVYLLSYGPDSFSSTDDELARNIRRMRDELVVAAQDDPISFADKMPDPKGLVPAIRGAAKSLAATTVGVQPAKVAFIYDKLPSESGWVALHEKGRFDLEGRMGPQVMTKAYLGCDDDERFNHAVGRALEDGADLVVTVSPRQFEQAVRAAVAFPKARLVNCSINLPSSSVRTFYARMYQVKFIFGALAASMSESHRIGYVAVSPIYGAVSEVNAFALGAAMVDSEATVFLKWLSSKDGNWRQELREDGVDVFSGIEYVDPTGENGPHGLNRVLPDGRFELLATPVWDWGRYYELIVQSLRDGSWKQDERATKGHARNYWLGMREGVVRIELAEGLATGQRRLVEVLSRALVEGGASPFDVPYSDDELASMRRLAPNIAGRLPRQRELSEDGRREVEAAGIISDTDGA